jgi:hypothetical protein
MVSAQLDTSQSARTPNAAARVSPGNAERPQRILDERLRRQHPQPPRMQVPIPPSRSM